MRTEFRYPGYEQIEGVDVPDANLMGIYGIKTIDNVNEQEVLAGGFAKPYDAPRLRECVDKGDRVLILIDDGTRTTPIDRILPFVLDELDMAGIPRQQITFLTAQGTHRRMSDDELKKKLGPFFGQFQIFQHDWLDESAMHDFGQTRDGTPIRANKLLAQSDFVLGIGGIVPHRVKGFSGGAKIAFPGVSGKEMMYRNQWEASMQMSETVMGVAENSMRLRMEEAARLAGLKYVVNVVGDASGKIVGCFCGDCVAAHRAGCRLSRQITAIEMPYRADIVLADCYPADRDIWQSAKGAYAATMAVRDGGSMIVVAPNPEGVAKNHPNLLEIGYRPHAEIVKLVQSGQVEDLVGVAILADICQIVDKTDCILVSPGVSQADAEKLGFRYARTCQHGLALAMDRQGPAATIAVLRHGGHILPLADARAEAACKEADEHESLLSQGLPAPHVHPGVFDPGIGAPPPPLP